MIIELAKNLGFWSWILAGVIFLTIEILAPGVLFLWLSVGALLVGVFGLLGAMIGLDMHAYVQFIAFAVFSMSAAYFGRNLYSAKSEQSDEPLLNKRFEQFLGQSVVLTEPIVNGKGFVKIGDTIWRVKGPDSKVGAKLKVVGEEDGNLVLETS